MNSIEINNQYKTEKKEAQKVLKMNKQKEKQALNKQKTIKDKLEQKTSQKSISKKKIIVVSIYAIIIKYYWFDNINYYNMFLYI